MKKRYSKFLLATIMMLQVILSSTGTISAEDKGTNNNDSKVVSGTNQGETRNDRDENKDGIADKYQIKIMYKAVNGIIDSTHANDENRSFYINLYKDGSLATKEEGGIGHMSEEQVATAIADTGYDQNTLSWYPNAPTVSLPLNEDTEFEATFSKSNLKQIYSIQYYYDNKAVNQQVIDAVEVNKVITLSPEQTVTYDGKPYVLDKTKNNPLTVTDNKDDNAISVYYAIDDNKDGIADKYQAEVTFTAVNGKVSLSKTYVTLYDDKGEVSENGTGKLSDNQIATALANKGYHFVNWAPYTPTKDLKITNKGAAFTAIHAIDTYVVKIHFINEDTGEELAAEKEINDIEQGSIVNGTEYKIDIKGCVFTAADTKHIEDSNLVVNVYYSSDTKGGHSDPDFMSDGIPDKFQLRFEYTANTNGSVTGTVVEYVTRPDNSTTASVRPLALVDAVSNNGYTFVEWKADEAVYSDTNIMRNTYFTKDTVFTAEFEEIAVPVLPTPETPNNPTMVPETPVASTTPELPVYVPAVQTLPTAMPENPVTQIIPVRNPVSIPYTLTPVPIETPEQTVTEDDPKQPQSGGEMTEVVNDNPTPKSGSEGSWALVNLLCAGGTVLLGLLLLLSKLKKEEDEEDDTSNMQYNNNDGQFTCYQRKKWLRVASIITAITTVLVFFLTEDITLSMILIDKWTLLMAAFLIVQIIFVLFGLKWKDVNDIETKEEVRS